MCIYMCMLMCVSAGVYVPQGTRGGPGKPQPSSSTLTQSLLLLTPEYARALGLTDVLHVWLYVGSGDLNSGLHIYIYIYAASTLPTEPSLEYPEFNL